MVIFQKFMTSQPFKDKRGIGQVYHCVNVNTKWTSIFLFWVGVSISYFDHVISTYRINELIYSLLHCCLFYLKVKVLSTLWRLFCTHILLLWFISMISFNSYVTCLWHKYVWKNEQLWLGRRLNRKIKKETVKPLSQLPLFSSGFWFGNKLSFHE